MHFLVSYILAVHHNVICSIHRYAYSSKTFLTRAKKQAAILKRRNEALREEVEKRLGDKLDEELSMGTLQKVISDLDKADSAYVHNISP